MIVSLVRFTPGAHTNWHRHAVGQTLHVTDGIGLVATRGGKIIRMRPGHTVYTPPGEEHWHGATDSTFMCHLAMLESVPGGDGATWLEPVTDEQYQAAKPAVSRAVFVSRALRYGAPATDRRTSRREVNVDSAGESSERTDRRVRRPRRGGPTGPVLITVHGGASMRLPELPTLGGALVRGLCQLAAVAAVMESMMWIGSWAWPALPWCVRPYR